jgi:hypothetical protein
MEKKYTIFYNKNGEGECFVRFPNTMTVELLFLSEADMYCPEMHVYGQCMESFVELFKKKYPEFPRGAYEEITENGELWVRWTDPEMVFDAIEAAQKCGFDLHPAPLSPEISFGVSIGDTKIETNETHWCTNQKVSVIRKGKEVETFGIHDTSKFVDALLAAVAETKKE